MRNNVPHSEPLIFPRGVRFLRPDEIPGDASDMLSRIAKAKIFTGYVIKQVGDQPYKSYIEANVHAPSVFEVFRQLAFALLPEVAAPFIGIKDEEPVFGPYTERVWAVAIFEPYIDLLQNDGFLEFGIVNQSEFVFEEIFVASPKYFKIWTNHGDRVEEILQLNNIPRCKTLEFIDNYPMVSLSIDDQNNAAWAGPFYAIQDEFPNLPRPLHEQ
ncbi:MAG TPA: hypothetical protein PKC89_14760 [Pyrinomonadaceae bacterium]|nr:hypothetical protein [Pyrinomonadaceae bacterium]